MSIVYGVAEYEHLLEIYETIELNENGLIDQKELRQFKIQTSRANRLYNGELNLRDYVTCLGLSHPHFSR